MASTLETVDKKTGQLGATEVVNSEVTKILAALYYYKEMLPAERSNEKALIEGIRDDVTRLRWYLDDHFQYKEKTPPNGKV